MPNKQLLVLQFNANHDSLATSLIHAEATSRRVDVVMISDPYIVRNAVPFAGWQQFCINRNVILVRRHLPASAVDMHHPDIVAVVVSGTLFVNIYSPPTVGDLSGVLEIVADRLTAVPMPTVICGDLNGNSFRNSTYATNSRGAIIEQFIDDSHLYLLNDKTPTRIWRHRNVEFSASPDFTIASDPIVTDWSVDAEDFLSDHRLINFRVSVGATVPEPPTKYRIDAEKLFDLIQTAEFPTLDPHSDADATDTYCNELAAQLFALADKASTPIFNSILSWWTDELAELRAMYNRAERLLKKSKNTLEAHLTKLVRNRLRRVYRHAIYDEKKRAWREFCTNQKAWGRAYSLVVRKRSANTSSAAVVNQPDAVLAAKFPDDPVPHDDDDLPGAEGPVQPLSSLAIAETLKTMPNRSAPGPDNVGYKVVKALHLFHPAVLTTLYNHCINIGHFPTPWKLGNVVLLPKPGKDLSTIDSYRPLTLLPTLGKVFERMIKIFLENHIAAHGGLHARQFGFRRYKSTEHCLHAILRHLDITLNDYGNDLTALLSFDIRGAFDHARWSDILRQLQKWCIPHVVLRVLRSYFRNRFVVYNGKTKQINRGCPQGSVLGPLLWNVNFDDVLTVVDEMWAELFAYADDTFAAISAWNPEVLTLRVAYVSRQINDFLASRSLSLNLAKTECIVLDRRSRAAQRLSPVRSLNVAGVRVHPTTQMKYLGVILDDELSWDAHISYIIDKASRYLPLMHSICRNTFGYSAWARRVMYSGTVLMLLKYCSSVFYQRLFTCDNKLKLRRLRRQVAINTALLYRSVSADAAGVIAGYPPFELLVAARSVTWLLKNDYTVPDFLFLPVSTWPGGLGLPLKKIFHDAVQAEWQNQWSASPVARWTHRLIPNVAAAPNINSLDFYSAQAMSDHGCFRAYLHKRRLAPSPLCECGDIESAQHVLLDCPRHAEGRPASTTRLDPRNPDHLAFMRSVVHRLWKCEQLRPAIQRVSSPRL